jgi:tetratricopeptide (TPR) repeat protein
MQDLGLAFRSRAVLAVIVAALAAATFWPVVRNGFAGYDDNEYVTANPRVHTGLTRENVRWAFAAVHSNNWHPLSWISHQVDSSLFGLNPAGHHAVSLAFHVANAALLFWWLAGLTGALGRSAFVAAVFAVHPLHVESVAWIAERKDVLSTFFGLLALLAWGAYVRKSGALRYFAAVVLFAASLLSKPMLVTLPIVLLLLDYWPLKRGLRLVEKLPLAAVSLLSALAAFWAQRQGGAVAAIEQLPLPLRLANAAVSYAAYLGKTVWPVDLAVFYPFPLNGIPQWKVAASLALLATISALAIAFRKRRPWLAVGWCWYVVTLLPVIGIVQVGMQSMADRYMYVPMIGLLIAVAWEAARILPVAGPIVVAACAILSWRQIPVWKDGLTLFTHTLAVTRDNFVAHDNLGVELDRRGRPDEAIAHYRETLRIKPGDRIGAGNLAQSLFEKGERLFNQGKMDEAFAVLQEGLQHRPNAAARANVALILLGRQQFAPAVDQFRAALALDQSILRAQVGLGVALANLDRFAEALHAFEQAIRLDPANVEARFNLAMVSAAAGNRADALRHIDVVLKLNPDYPNAKQIRAALMGQ